MKTLKQWRDDRYLSVRELARMANVTQATVSYIENGKTVPRQLSIRKIAAALEVSPDDVEEFAATKESRKRSQAEA